MAKVRIILAVLLVARAFLPAKAADRGGAGMYFSPKACGLEVFFPSKEGSVSRGLLLADLDGVLDGKRSLPSIKGEYFIDYKLFEHTGKQGLTFAMLAGPGIMAGYAPDRGKERGLVAGICGEVGMKASFLHGIELRLSFCAELGLHSSRTDLHSSTLTLYRGGLEKCFWPALSITKSF